MDTIKSERDILKRFGISLGTVFLLMTLFIFKRSPRNIWPVFLLSCTFYILALIKPSLLKPVYAVFMKFGLAVTWIIGRIALFIIFYFLFTPMGLIMRLLGVDLLDRKIDNHKESYWRKKEKDPRGPPGYERQF